MTSRTFEFTIGKRGCFAQGHANSRQSVVMVLHAGDILGADVGFNVTLTADEAHAMAVALEAAATHAESTLPTGLGESVAA